MKSLERRPIWGRVGSSVAVAVALAVVLLAQHPTMLAQGAGERWVGTWGTAEVARPQNPLPPAPPLPPFMMNKCPVAPAPAVTPAPGPLPFCDVLRAVAAPKRKRR